MLQQGMPGAIHVSRARFGPPQAGRCVAHSLRGVAGGGHTRGRPTPAVVEAVACAVDRGETFLSGRHARQERRRCDGRRARSVPCDCDCRCVVVRGNDTGASAVVGEAPADVAGASGAVGWGHGGGFDGGGCDMCGTTVLRPRRMCGMLALMPRYDRAASDLCTRHANGTCAS